MAAFQHHPRAWISLWFLLSTLLVVWDAGYCFFRPRSMVGGDLHWIWSPYALYANVDHVYGLPSFESNDGFTNAQSALNVVESALNFLYLYLAHLSPASEAAPLVGFTSVVMTLSKTVLYWLQASIFFTPTPSRPPAFFRNMLALALVEHFCDWCKTGHNNGHDFVLLWIIPNGLWLVFPALITYVFGREIFGALRLASQSSPALEGKKKRV